MEEAGGEKQIPGATRDDHMGVRYDEGESLRMTGTPICLLDMSGMGDWL